MEIDPLDIVYNLKCSQCSALLTPRGRKTSLVSDYTYIVYASDFATTNLIESLELRDFHKCKCKIRDVFCKNCEKKVGYHVIYPCVPCTSENYLPFFWLFYAEFIKEEKNELYTWKNAPGLPQNHETIDPVNVVPDYLFCGICFNLMEEASILRCGHTFCRICITRVIDLHQRCPFDKIAVSGEMVFPNFLARDVINDVLIKCGKCKEIMKLGEKSGHETNSCGVKKI